MNNKDIKILLVDDEPDILEIVSYNLSAEGYPRQRDPALIIYTVMILNWKHLKEEAIRLDIQPLVGFMVI